MAAASEKRRCHYEVLGVVMDSTAEEIRSAYRKLALQLHPDKLIQSGLSQSEATAKFQELSHSYEVLSDPKERSWYDSHRSKILFTTADSSSSSSSAVVPDLFSFFSNSAFSGYSSDNKKSFFKVYSDVFNRVYATELEFTRRMSAVGAAVDEVEEAPAMGDLDSPYAQAAAFYAYWTGFSTVLDFSWAEPYDAAAGENRKSRRVMEEENKKARRKARREYSDTVRGLAEFVKKRDKRVIDMAVKKKEAEERRRAEERDRRKREERERLERAMAFQEPEWARAAGDAAEDDDDVAEEEAEELEELYCVACGKRFKSDKQWKNHERSKKHRENVDRIRKEFVSDDDDDVIEEEEEPEDKNKDEDDVLVEELEEMMRDKAHIEVREEEEEEEEEKDKDEIEIEIDNVVDEEEKEQEDKKYEDEIGVLEAMLGGRRNRKKAVALDKNDDEVMEYNDRKSTRKSRRRAKKGNNENGTKNGEEEKYEEEEEKEKLVVEKKGINAKSEANNGSKSKASSKGKKAKGGSKNSSNNECEKCGEEFESRSKLHKHLSDSGHASLKYR